MYKDPNCSIDFVAATELLKSGRWTIKWPKLIPNHSQVKNLWIHKEKQSDLEIDWFTGGKESVHNRILNCMTGWAMVIVAKLGNVGF